MGFKRHDDRISSMEAPVTEGVYMDASGNPWDNRPDNVLQRYMSKVAMTQDEYWKYEEYKNKRQWFEMEMFLERLQNRASKDDTARLAHALQIVQKIQRDSNE